MRKAEVLLFGESVGLFEEKSRVVFALLNGKKRHLARKDFVAFAEACAISPSRFDRTLKRFLDVFEKRLPEALMRSFLSDTFKSSLLAEIDFRLKVLA